MTPACFDDPYALQRWHDDGGRTDPWHPDLSASLDCQPAFSELPGERASAPPAWLVAAQLSIADHATNPRA